MFTQAELLIWYQANDIPEAARNIIERIRSSEPVRLVQSGRGSMSSRYPSRKMGVTIQSESHKNELPHIYEMEHDHDVIEYYDQPSTISLDYEGVNGRHIVVMHTPDFFEVRKDCAGWTECKTEEQLVQLEAENPNRFRRDEDGQWHCPPGEKYAEQFGLFYRVKTSKDINWTFQRNIDFLDDYLRANSPSVADKSREVILKEVSAEPSITLAELFRKTEGIASRDDIFMMIAHEEVYVDLYAVPMVDFDYVRIFPDEDTAVAYTNIVQVSPTAVIPAPSPVNISTGNCIQWDGKGWMVANAGETLIGLLGEDNAFTELPIATFEALLREWRVTGINSGPSSGMHPEVKKRLAEASKDDLAEANFRLEIVRARLRGEFLTTDPPVSERTKQYWTAEYLKCEQTYGCGYVGLIRRKNRGNQKAKLAPETKELLDKFIENDYETLKQKRKREVYAAYRLASEQTPEIIPASYKKFCQAVKARPRHQQTLARQGRRAAYASKEFYWELEMTTPRHGERPFQIGHIDHTEADTELICALTGKDFGRPWVSFLTDAYSRRLLAIYATYDAPSKRTCMMLIRECVRRYGRMPQTVIVDGGREFSSVYFETLLARYECTKKTRPPAESRFGSTCERLFGTANTQFFHNLQGNTQIMKNVRQVTKSVNPKGQALWTLEALLRKLSTWGYEFYDTLEHPALGQSPREAFAAGMALYGRRLHGIIPYDDDFRMLTFPTTKKGTAKVYPGRGVKINYIYYWTDAFRAPGVEGCQVPVRYDPWDAGTAYIFVRGKWCEAYSEYRSVFRHRSEREIMIATEAMRKKNKRHTGQFNISALKLARFLESVEAEEVLLRQRLADREVHNAWSMIDDRTSSSSDENPVNDSTVTSTPSDVPGADDEAQNESSPAENKAINFETYGAF